MFQSRKHVAIALLFGAQVACHGEPTQPHLTHAMVGTYDVHAAYSSHTTSTGGTSAVNASLTGTITIADTVELRSSSGDYFFPDVRMTFVFCSAPGTCDPPQAWTSFTTLPPSTSPQNGVVTFGFGGIVHLDAPFVNGGFSGNALYWVGADQRNTYIGTFVATKK